MKQTEAGQGQGSRPRSGKRHFRVFAAAVTTDMSPGIKKLDRHCRKKGWALFWPLELSVSRWSYESLGGFLGEQQTFDVR